MYFSPARFVQSRTYAANLAADALTVESGRPLLKGIRASKSYNVLSEAAELEWKKSEMVRSSSKDEDIFLAYGLSPRSVKW